MKLTAKEIEFVKALTENRASNWGEFRVDFSKSEIGGEGYWEEFLDTKELHADLPQYTERQIKGYIGKLVQKGVFTVESAEDTGIGCAGVFMWENGFNIVRDNLNK